MAPFVPTKLQRNQIIQLPNAVIYYGLKQRQPLNGSAMPSYRIYNLHKTNSFFCFVAFQLHSIAFGWCEFFFFKSSHGGIMIVYFLIGFQSIFYIVIHFWRENTKKQLRISKWNSRARTGFRSLVLFNRKAVFWKMSLNFINGNLYKSRNVRPDLLCDRMVRLFWSGMVSVFQIFF